MLVADSPPVNSTIWTDTQPLGYGDHMVNFIDGRIYNKRSLITRQRPAIWCAPLYIVFSFEPTMRFKILWDLGFPFKFLDMKAFKRHSINGVPQWNNESNNKDTVFMAVHGKTSWSTKKSLQKGILLNMWKDSIQIGDIFNMTYHIGATAYSRPHSKLSMVNRGLEQVGCSPGEGAGWKRLHQADSSPSLKWKLSKQITPAQKSTYTSVQVYRMV